MARDRSIELLRQRYASGEIDEAEFERRRDFLVARKRPAAPPTTTRSDIQHPAV